MYKKWKLNEDYFISFNHNSHHTGGYFSVTKWKGLEWNIYHQFSNPFNESGSINFDLWIRRKGDHPGISIEFSIFGFGLEFDFYDGRHFDGGKYWEPKGCVACGETEK